MKITDKLKDDAVLAELGDRLARRRIDVGLTQADAAERAGISTRTVSRIESGQSAQLSSWIRLLRALDRLDELDVLARQPDVSPMELLRDQRKRRKRASASRTTRDSDWTWGDDG